MRPRIKVGGRGDNFEMSTLRLCPRCFVQRISALTLPQSLFCVFQMDFFPLESPPLFRWRLQRARGRRWRVFTADLENRQRL